MHIVDGVLSLPVLAVGNLAAVGGTALGLKKMDLDHVPQVGLLSAAFFLSSLIHVPIGPSSVHLILNGLVGLVLGWTAFPALLVGLLLQAVFFGFGGLIVLGVNTVNIALPGVLLHYLLKPVLSHAFNRQHQFLWGSLAGSMAIALTTGLVALSLALSGDAFLPAAQLVFVAHLPIMVLEGFLTGAAVVFIAKVKPDMFQLSDHLSHEAPEVDPETGKAIKQVALVLLVIFPFFISRAEAHNMVGDVYVEGNRVEGEVGFSSGKPAVSAQVTVKDAEGNLLATTQTDAEGLFAFTAQQQIDHHFEVNAGSGHVFTLVVTAQELGRPSPEGNTAPPNTEISSPPPPLNDTQLAVLVEQAVAKQVKPLRKQLLRLENTLRFHDILGGLGYIAGLTGLGMWFALRRKNRAS